MPDLWQCQRNLASALNRLVRLFCEGVIALNQKDHNEIHKVVDAHAPASQQHRLVKGSDVVDQ